MKENNPTEWKGARPLRDLSGVGDKSQFPPFDPTQRYWPPKIPKPAPVVPDELLAPAPAPAAPKPAIEKADKPKAAPTWGGFSLGKHGKKLALATAAIAAGGGCVHVVNNLNAPYTVSAPLREARGTVVLDLGHGSYMGKDADGKPVEKADPGARVVLKTHADKTVTLRNPAENETAADLGPGEQMINEADITAAMGARIALQLLKRGYDVRFTRHIDVKHNPYLKDLSESDREIIEVLNSDVTTLASRFNARIEQVHRANDGKKPVAYLVLHADKAVNNARRGGAVSVDPETPDDSASNRLSKSLQFHYREAKGGSLGSNATKGVIPDQKGFGARYDKDCSIEIGFGTRDVTIITRNPTETVKKGLGDIPTSLIEMGFLSSASDTYRLRNQKWANNFARVTAEGFDNFFTKEYDTKQPVVPEKPVMIGGVKAEKLPADPKKAATMVAAMQLKAQVDPRRPAEVRTKEVTFCTPSGKRYTENYAAFVPKPKPQPAANHADLAKRDDGAPRTRS